MTIHPLSAWLIAIAMLTSIFYMGSRLQSPLGACFDRKTLFWLVFGHATVFLMLALAIISNGGW